MYKNEETVFSMIKEKTGLSILRLKIEKATFSIMKYDFNGEEDRIKRRKRDHSDFMVFLGNFDVTSKK